MLNLKMFTLNLAQDRGLFATLGADKSVTTLVVGQTVTPKIEDVEYILIVESCPIQVGVITGPVPAE